MLLTLRNSDVDVDDDNCDDFGGVVGWLVGFVGFVTACFIHVVIFKYIELFCLLAVLFLEKFVLCLV